MRKVPTHQQTTGQPDEWAVQQALVRSGYGDLRQLDVSEVDGRIRVDGCVHSYFMKQKAQTIAMSVAAHRELQNEVVVK